MSTKYTYTISSGTVNGKVGSNLENEIQASSIVTALDYIYTNNDTLDVWMKTTLSGGDETALNGLVAAHTGADSPIEPLIPRDSDGSPFYRAKITTSGWHYQLHGLEFETSKLTSVRSCNAANANLNYATIKFYKDVSGTETEITGEDLNQTFLDANCIKTVMDWEPTQDYEMLGGMVFQKVMPISDIHLWVVGVPDISAAYGGSKEFVSHIDLTFIGLESGIKVDGRAPKYLTYSATYHTNKLRFILRHSAGYKHVLHVVFEIFKA